MQIFCPDLDHCEDEVYQCVFVCQGRGSVCTPPIWVCAPRSSLGMGWLDKTSCVDLLCRVGRRIRKQSTGLRMC